jgi:hypothetical protein
MVQVLRYRLGKTKRKSGGAVEPVRGDKAVLARPVIRLSELGIE